MDKDQMVKSCGTKTLAKCHIVKRPNCAHNIYIGISAAANIGICTTNNYYIGMCATKNIFLTYSTLTNTFMIR